MNPKTIAWITGLTLYGLSAAWTGAQTVTIYKCVVDGKVMLQQTPCLAGDEKRMEVYTGQSVDADQEAEVRKAIDQNVKSINSQSAAMHSLYNTKRQAEGRLTVEQEAQINAMSATARQLTPNMNQFNSARAAEQQRLQASTIEAAESRPANHPPRIRPPVTYTQNGPFMNGSDGSTLHCSGGFCHGNNGTTYSRSGPFMHGSDGTTKHCAGGFCN